MATADTEIVSVAAREAWFRDFTPERRPLWVSTAPSGEVEAWLSVRSFYGRPAYHRTAEISAYTAPAAQRRGLARTLLDHAIGQAPRLGLSTFLAFVFGHNVPQPGAVRARGLRPTGAGSLAWRSSTGSSATS